MNLYRDALTGPVTTERIRLELRRVGMTLAQSAEYSAHDDHFRGVLTHRLKAYVLSDHLVSDTYSKDYEVPASWWQHLKQDHFPGWWLSRWPVKTDRRTVTVKFDRYATYPHARIALPDLGKPYYIETAVQS